MTVREEFSVKNTSYLFVPGKSRQSGQLPEGKLLASAAFSGNKRNIHWYTTYCKRGHKEIYKGNPCKFDEYDLNTFVNIGIIFPIYIMLA